jgi:hypothetical protein
MSAGEAEQELQDGAQRVDADAASVLAGRSSASASPRPLIDSDSLSLNASPSHALVAEQALVAADELADSEVAAVNARAVAFLDGAEGGCVGGHAGGSSVRSVGSSEPSSTCVDRSSHGEIL